MKHIKLSQAAKFENSSNCTVFEYGSENNIDGCIAEINGNYPEDHSIQNKLCDMVVYVVSGNGKVFSGEETYDIENDDVIFIPRETPYRWIGEKLKLFIACNPPFTPDQYEEVD